MKAEEKLRYPCEILRWVGDERRHGHSHDSASVLFPEYVPPVLVEEAAEGHLRHVGRLFAAMAQQGDRITASACYEDYRDAISCCVCLRMQSERSDGEEIFVDHEWLDSFGKTAEHLLLSSIDLRLKAERNTLIFELRLPVFKAENCRTGWRETILLVEDDAHLRLVTRQVLEMDDRQVIESATAEEGLRIFLKNRLKISLVISDVTLPRRSGTELATRVHACAPATPILLVSGFIPAAGGGSASKMHFLEKPYDARSLRREVDRCLATGTLGYESGPRRAIASVSD